MKKIFYKLAAMLFMAALVMTSCSKNLDADASAEKQGNIVTITIAPPAQEAETRVAINDQFMITGWELNDEVYLYKVDFPEETGEAYKGISKPVSFKCINASEGKFSGDIGSTSIGDYNFAVFGATASISTTAYMGDPALVLTPKTRSSVNLKDVVMMAALKSGSSYIMRVVNSVLQVTNNKSQDYSVAWNGKTHLGASIGFFDPLAILYYDSDEPVYGSFWTGILLKDIPASQKGDWSKASHYTLEKNKVTYVNMCLSGHSYEQYGLAESNSTFVVPLKNKIGDYQIYKTTIN